MAKTIQKEVKDSKIPIQDGPGREMLFGKLKIKYKNFYDSLPIVFKWMVELDEFNAKALRLYMKRNPSLYWKTQDGWIDATAGYLTDVFRFKHNHMDESRVKAYREKVFNLLKKTLTTSKRNTTRQKRKLKKKKPRSTRNAEKSSKLHY